MASRKLNTEGIDESLLLASIGQDYGTTFLRRSELKSRKCVYISAEAHDIVSKIVNTIADKEITVGGYIDTVLVRHFEENKDEINELYRRDRDNLI